MGAGFFLFCFVLGEGALLFAEAASAQFGAEAGAVGRKERKKERRWLRPAAAVVGGGFLLELLSNKAENRRRG